MKKSSILLCTAALLLLTACGGGSDNTGGNAAEPGGAAVVENGGVSDSASGGGTEAAEGGYVFTSGGTEIVIDALAAPILEALGEPDSYYEAASCAFDGLDKYYTFASFEVDTYPDASGVDRISAVLLKDDLVSTAEGVSIGSSSDDVAAAYGEGAQDGSSLVYEKGGMKLVFILDGGGFVESVQYQTKALDA